MNFKARIAQRSQVKLKIGLSGPSGSGKTYSALLMAHGMTGDWGKIGVIDTENGSSELYADLGGFVVIPFEPPYSPERYIEAINYLIAEYPQIEIIVIDSISHEWDGKGGILETHGNMTGNSFTNWSKLTPRHNAFMEKILHTGKHFITTMRSKTDYVLVEKNGKQVPEKVGLKAVTREGWEYELSVVLDLDIKHMVTASKDRTRLFMDQPQFIISEETGKRLISWANSGETVLTTEQHIDKLKGISTVEGLESYWNDNVNTQGNKWFKDAVKSRKKDLAQTPDAEDVSKIDELNKKVQRVEVDADPLAD